MSDAYETRNIVVDGQQYRIEYCYDFDTGAPWEECDGHGIVSEWVTRDKRPCELVFNTDRGSKRFYDVQASIAKAKTEGWGLLDSEGLTANQIAAKAVEQDFKHLKAWCDNEWHWCGIVVTEIRTDADGFTYDANTASLWGIASDSGEAYFDSVIQDLIADIAGINAEGFSRPVIA